MATRPRPDIGHVGRAADRRLELVQDPVTRTSKLGAARRSGLVEATGAALDNCAGYLLGVAQLFLGRAVLASVGHPIEPIAQYAAAADEEHQQRYEERHGVSPSVRMVRARSPN